MTPENINVLSDADVKLLRELVRRIRNTPLNRLLNPESVRHSPAPDVYLAEVPAEGIAAISGDTPGSATCGVYHIVNGVLEAITGFERVVYNVTGEAIPAGYVTIMRTKAGDWITVSPSTGKKRLCRFVLNAALATTDASAEAHITHQYGSGADHTVTGTGTSTELVITVHNLYDDEAAAYTFSGILGRAGLAYWDSDTDWIILQMYCSE